MPVRHKSVQLALGDDPAHHAPTMEGARSTTIVAGIDEAGYGPLLGPLVVSAAAFEVPTDSVPTCLWRVLRRSISRTQADADRRIPVLDSKKLYHRRQGLQRLERSVLAVSTAWRQEATGVDSWISQFSSEAGEILRPYPWYRACGRCLPIEADARAVRLAAESLKRDLGANSIRVAGCWTEILPEGHFNRLVERTRNKATVLQGLVLRLIQRIADAFPAHDLQINIDKQGARSFYAQPLLQAFDGRRLKVIEETESSSAYEMLLPHSRPARGDDALHRAADAQHCGAGTPPCGTGYQPVHPCSRPAGASDAHGARSRWQISFVESGESKHLPIALASMISKYVRELLMLLFNEYWCSRVDNLKSTAGYYQDGLRFLGDIRPHLGRLGVAEEQLVRRHSGLERRNEAAHR